MIIPLPYLFRKVLYFPKTSPVYFRCTSLQCSLYHHLQNELNPLLQQNQLYIYPEFYFKELKFFADLAIAEMDMSLEKTWLSEKMTDIAAIIELKHDSGNAMSPSDYIKTEMPKLKEYVRWLDYDCQYYFGVIYENDCEWLHWFDKRSSNNFNVYCIVIIKKRCEICRA